MEVVLDTWVFVSVNQGSQPDKELLEVVLTSPDHVMIASARTIQAYQARGGKPGGLFLTFWWAAMLQRGKVVIRKASFSGSEREELGRQRFQLGKQQKRLDRDDVELLALASNSTDRLLVSEEPGFVAATDYLRRKFGVRRVSAADASEVLRRTPSP